MLYMKIILKSLCKRKFSSFLIVMQLTITICVLINSFIMVSSTNYLQNQVRHKGIDLDKTMKLYIYNPAFNSAFQEKYNKLEDYINDIPEITNFGGFDFTNAVFKELENNSSYLALRENSIKGTFKEEFPTSSEMLMIDRNIYELLRIQIIEGQNLKKDDFYKDEKEVIPILAGESYRNVLRIGEILTQKDNDVKYKIVGFVHKNSSWFNDQDYISNMFTNLDDKFIIPYTKVERESIPEILSKSGAIFYTVNDQEKVEYVKNIIDLKATSLNIRVNSYSISEDLIKFKKNADDILYISLFLALFLIVLSCLGISTVMMSSILSRKREFGIRMSAGASKSYIKKLIVGEVSFLAVISSIVAIVIVFIDNLNSQQYAKYNDIGVNPMENITPQCIMFISLITILIIIITTFIPLRKFNKIQTKELIGGVE